MYNENEVFKAIPAYYEKSNFYLLVLLQEGYLTIHNNLDKRIYFRDYKLKPIMAKLLQEQAMKTAFVDGNVFKSDGSIETISKKLAAAASGAAIAYWQKVPRQQIPEQLEKLAAQIKL